MLSLDGSYGEGGGQVLRTALSLAALTGVAVRIEGIRARRSKPPIFFTKLSSVQNDMNIHYFLTATAYNPQISRRICRTTPPNRHI